ncbi:hypothetical protein BU26DRAFT_545068 [Trematosphaeria pertusa]|uniref:Fungal-type protein kinase domain-containing protein n=1 Tax=Trematosphaeria pertusa TaxID=390896 RepID=A0A6A6HQ83_9PLEO|nr:uncharacterized protein BU26DRAFT_545068 [Trematosphaeria pertusa]KAF2240285.1 hypothetical protein BU26DRAFT_545068 [Trematosphaeria pertusa]
MTTLSRSEILQSKPIGKGLDGFRETHTSNSKDIDKGNEGDEGEINILVDLMLALQSLPASRLLPSKRGNTALFNDLLSLNSAIFSGNHDTARIKPLLGAVLNKEPDEVIWDRVYDAVTESTPPPRPASSFPQTPWLRNTSSFANSTEHRKYVDKVLKEELGPMHVDIPSFFEAFFGEIAEPAARTPASEARRRPLAQLYQPVQGSTANRKLDVGFKQILVPGELKSNLSADIASKAWLDLGRYAREFDQLKDGLQFVSALRFNPSIITDGDVRYIKIERSNQKERLIIDKVMKQSRCVVGRATTCWKVHREGDESRSPLVVKDLWQFLERKEEGELLRKATNNDDDIRSNVRRGLDITQAKNCKLESLIAPLSLARRRISRKGQSSSAAGRKQSLSCTGALLPPSKQTCSTSLVKGSRATANRVHRRVIVQDYRKPIYKASSRVSLLAALEGYINRYESLHTRAGVLQYDISPNNLIHAFLINLNLAIKEQQEKSLEARGKTSTRAFMAIRVLLDNKNHSFMHDLESDQKLAELKLGLVSRERHFLNRITNAFTLYY